MANKKFKYIVQLRKLFSKEFNTSNTSKKFPNFRLHYVDIRDYVIYQNNKNFPIDMLHSHISNLWDKKLDLIEEDYENIKSNLSNSQALIDNLNDLFKDQVFDVQKQNLLSKNYDEYASSDFESATKYIINKLHNKYKHNDIKTKINNIIKTYLEKAHDIINGLYDDMYKYVDESSMQYMKTKNKVFSEKYGDIHYDLGYYNSTLQLSTIYLKTDRYYLMNTNIFAMIMDFYFMRRFLDKDYITNTIGYVGGYHAVNYIYFLVKYFNFKITHWSFLRENVDMVHNKIKKSNDPGEIGTLFYPDILHQCTDMTNFPDNFE